MVLEKLGQALKKTTDKIASAVFIDKKLINSVVKDLQRALIEADVDVKLVKEITDELKEKAKEKIKGVEKKEHIIKLIHDKLREILGGEKKELKLEKRGKNKEPEKVMLLGLYGSGKCVHSESNIQLGDGNIIKAEQLYNKYKNDFEEQKLEDGKIIDTSKANLYVPSFNPNTAKIENKKVTYLWKLDKKELMEVKAYNGNDFSIKVTPEHPFFVLDNGKIIQKRADNLEEKDFIALPRETKINGKIMNLTDKIKNLDLFVCLDKEEIRKIIEKKNKTKKEIHGELKHKKNYIEFIKNLKKGKIPIELINIEKFNSIKIKTKGSSKAIDFPLFLTPELAEFLGYLMGDGHLEKKYLQITTENEEVINRIKYLSKNLFDLDLVIKKDKRTKSAYRLNLNSATLVKLMGIFKLSSGRKGRKLKIPEEILLSNNDVVRSFIRAYFDCDSHASSKNREITLCSESKILIKQMNLLLNRFGIASIISKRSIKNVLYWRLTIKSVFAEKYADKIGYLIEKKQRTANNYQTIELTQGCGNQNMLPLGRLLKDLRIKLGFSIGEIQEKAVFSYGRYEKKGFISREHLKKLINYYKTKKLGRFFNILNSLSNKEDLYETYSHRVINGIIQFLKEKEIINKDNKGVIGITNNGILQLQKIKQGNLDGMLTELEILSESHITWVPVREVKKINNDKKVVYDLTVEDNHSFIAEGFVVHNTTTIAKMANYYKKRGFKTCMIGLDVHRPAAPEQLEQLGKKHNLDVFIDKKEKKPEKIYEKFKTELKKYDIVFIDTAGRHSLDKKLVKEIKKLNKKIKPDYSILTITADIGQSAKSLAEDFKKTLNINGVIVTRMDSTAKAGGSLTSCNEVKARVYFIATGEKINDLETFNPSSFISRILGLGSLETLIEKVESAVDKEKGKKLKKRIEQGKFTMDDLYEQLKSMKGVGSFSKIASLIPGFGKIKGKLPENQLEKQEDRMKKWKHAINSMTKQERENPDILNTSRIQRIANGSGIHTSDIRALLKQYKMLKEFMKTGQGNLNSFNFNQKQLKKMAKKFGKFKL